MGDILQGLGNSKTCCQLPAGCMTVHILHRLRVTAVVFYHIAYTRTWPKPLLFILASCFTSSSAANDVSPGWAAFKVVLLRTLHFSPNVLSLVFSAGY